MPDSRRHRGPHPKDAECFCEEAAPKLRNAVAELSWMLSRGYSKRTAMKLVGDRHALRDRQRKAVQRCAASDQSCLERRRIEVEEESLDGEALLLDGYNVLLTVEAALSGGVILVGRDGSLRDIAAMSLHYRRVEATRSALQLIADFCLERGCSEVIWHLDRPISNSGRLKATMEDLAASNHWPWRVELVRDPDRTLASSSHIVSTSDSGILEHCRRWFNLTRHVIETSIPDAWLLDLSAGIRSG